MADNKNPEWRNVWMQIRDALCSGNGVVISILGERGVGKTQLAHIAGQYTVQILSGNALYTTSKDLYSDIKSTYGPTATLSESAIMRHYTDPHLLIIDAIEAREKSAADNETFNHIIDKRYYSCLDTILISNHDPKRFVEVVGPSVCSRMQEIGLLIVCNWKSFRNN